MQIRIHLIISALIIILFVVSPVIARILVSDEQYYALGVGIVSLTMLFVYLVFGVTASVIIAWKVGRSEGSVIMASTAIGLVIGVTSCFAFIPS